MNLKLLLAAFLLTVCAKAQPVFTHTANSNCSINDVVMGDAELLIVLYGYGTEAGNTVTVRDPLYFSPPYIPVRIEPVWVYAVETRPNRLGLRPCFHTVADTTCEAARTFPLNYVSFAGNMPALEFTPSMPHYAIWRIDYPGGMPSQGGIGAPEMTVVWARVVPL